ncbi:PilZ domain-containing protein [Vallitalea pronyensis]|uniref:PilZ domain-containing protein n=1 Tax=Vallitalea pronyensis TaxID=1348613 RepID=A0A8J8SGX5_9FIRM|nr:flagellar brake protein [Vallitalea pronyensis]QUI23245.1 PilZ domain-containing protein [Vallitalea pronyensis]
MIHKALSLGDKIEISRSKFNRNEPYENQKIYVSIIQDIVDDELIISAPVENGKIIPLEIGTSYMISIYTKGGLFNCKAKVSKRTKKNQLYLITLSIESELIKSQRRQYFRLDCIMPISFSEKESEEWHHGLVVDISGGGLRFTSKIHYETNPEVTCQFDLVIDEEIKRLEIIGQVVDSRIIDFETMRYETRVMFDDIANEDREIIIKYIFEEQRKRRKRQKGL